MKKQLLALVCILISINAFNQNVSYSGRYVDRVFNEVNKIPDVQYSTALALNNNLSAFAASLGLTVTDYNIHNGEGTTADQDLRMDIYEPKSDELTNRPAIIFVHGGAFLLGSKENEDMVALCDSFAHLGYVTASIDYRLGMGATVTTTIYPPSVSVTVNEENATRAVYRAVQDANSAVNFLRENATTYGIDPDRIYMAGSSAGAFSTMYNVYLDKTSEIPEAAKGFGGGGDLGGMNKYCNTAYTWTSNAMVAYWGALQETGMIEDNTTPILLVHGMTDDTIPFKKGEPLEGITSSGPGFTVELNMPATYGSYCIDTALAQRGIEHETYFVDGVGHEFYGCDNGDFPATGPNAYWDIIYAKTKGFLYNQLAATIDFEYIRMGKTVELKGAIENSTGTETVSWTIDGEGINSGNIHTTHVFSDNGNHKIVFTVEKEDGTIASISKTISISANTVDYNSEIEVVADASGIVYVKEDGAGNGSSWANALNGFYLQNALNEATATQVWVNAGTYYPTQFIEEGTDRMKSFRIPEETKVYGGFDSEVSIETRAANSYSILSGDIGTLDVHSDNSYHVVVCDSSDNAESVIVDGFEIRGGNANMANTLHHFGGGIVVQKGTVVQNCIITKNYAEIGAGAVTFQGGTFTNCLFEENVASENGGGLALLANGTVKNSIIRNNEAEDRGAGIYIEGGKGNIISCIVDSNQTEKYGAGIYFRDASGAVINSSIYSNEADASAGGIYLYNSSADVQSCSIIKNTALSYGGGIRLYEGAKLNMNNSLVWGNTSGKSTLQISTSTTTTPSTRTINYTAVQDMEYTGVGNIELSADNEGSATGENYPMFSDPNIGDYSLKDGSACINIGLNSAIAQSTDVLGNPRIVDGIVDLGAIENQSGGVTYQVIAIASEHGTVSPDTVFVEAGSSQIFTITPDEHYKIDSIINNSTNVTSGLVASGSNYTYTLNISENAALAVYFSLEQFTLTATAGTGGAVTPQTETVVYGSSQTFTISPDAGYKVATAAYNSKDVSSELVASGNNYTYTVNDVAEDGSLEITFSATTGILDTDNDGFQVYPNPANNTIHIQLGADNAPFSLRITDVTGKLVLSKDNTLETTVDISSLSNDLYMLQLVVGDKTLTKLIVKQ